MSKCDQWKGLFIHCKKESLHPGDHDNGRTTWARIGSDLRIYQLTLAEIERLSAERRRLEELVARQRQQESSVTANGPCQHSFTSSTEFGDIKYKYSEEGDPYPYRVFWNVNACTRCGESQREYDEYYGDDMATIHVTWQRV
jgi:hypothetical protein